MRSIKSRLLLTSLLVLVGFMLLTAFVLEQAVEQRMLRAEEDKLQAQMYSILAAVDRDSTGLSITVSDTRLFEHGLFNPQSSLRALLYSEDAEIWRSVSTLESFPRPQNLAEEEMRFSQMQHDDERWFQLAFSIRWPNVHARLDVYHLVLWKNARDYTDQLKRFRQTLWSWLAVTIALLLMLMWLVMLWGLRPLRLIGDEIKAIENGEKDSLDSRYPGEIKPLTQNLNRLLQRERHQMQRYRHALDDLAHSLKTPLAVLTGLSEKPTLAAEDLKTLVEQSARMNQIVTYQLKKAATVGGDVMTRPVNLSALLSKTVRALEKVYRHEKVRIELDSGEDIPLRMDESDLLEVLGNLVDNACKYGAGRVRVRVMPEEMVVRLIVEDNGNGLDMSRVDQILTRGKRFDQSREGQGIGLAVVRDVVEAYEIGLEFGRSSELGGLSVELIFTNV